MENEIVVGSAARRGWWGFHGNNLANPALAWVFLYIIHQLPILDRGGHSWSPEDRFPDSKCMGDQVQAMIALNQDSIDRIFRTQDRRTLCLQRRQGEAGPAPEGVQLCPCGIRTGGKDAMPIMQNTVCLGGLVGCLGLDYLA